jgi:beta-glucosidase
MARAARRGRVRFLDADGAELFTEDRRSTALVWFGGDAPISRSATVEVTTRFSPAESGPVASASPA